MEKIRFVPLHEVDRKHLIALMNEERVGRFLPLMSGRFTEGDCDAFLAAKKEMWDRHGYGPQAFLIEGEFAGWGGLQPEQGEADFALVLHPDFWGWGRKILQKILEQAFGEMKLDAITILLPPGRPNSKAVRRLGFVPDGSVSVDGEDFERFRLTGKGGQTVLSGSHFR